jgi:hypothetical protein
MTENKKWFSSLTPLSHKEYVTFGDDNKGKVLGTGVIKVNDCFTLNEVALVDRLRYNLLFISQLCDADLSVLSGISNTLLSLGFGILLLLHWILLAFPLLILWVMGLTERAPLGLVIFLDLLSFAGLLENNLQLHSPPLRPSM